MKKAAATFEEITDVINDICRSLTEKTFESRKCLVLIQTHEVKN